MRTRSQPESPSGFAVLEFSRGPRARRNISQVPPGPPASRPATGARSTQLHAANEEEHESNTNTRLTTVESKQSGSTRAPRRQTRAASKTTKDDESQASSTAPLQSLHSVEIEHNAPTKGKESEGVRTRRQTRATSADTGPQSTAKGKEPKRARSTHQTKSTNSNTTKGKEPEGGQTRRQTRATLADTGHNSAKGKMPKRARSTRQTKSKSANSATTKGKEPKGGKTRQTRTTSADVGHGSTAKGTEPESGTNIRKTRSTSRKTSRQDPDADPATKLGELGESRKRRRSNEEERPIAKRLNTGAPITPVRRRRAIDPLLGRLSQPVLRRRQLEPVGPSFLDALNVQRTLFQIPQRVAQLRALQAMETTDATDATDATETTKTVETMDTNEATKNMNTHKENLNLQMEQGEPDKIIPADESTSQQAYPETPRRGWNVRGLLNSIPRSFSRFIPSLGGNAQEPAGEVPEAHRASEMPTAPEAHRESDIPKAPVFRQPSPENGHSEQASRAKTPEPEPEPESESESPLSAADIRYRESLKEFERNLKHVRIGDRDLTWSLQPRPMHPGERNLDGTLKKTPKTSKTHSKTPSKDTPKATFEATQARPKLTPKSPSKQASTDDAKSPSKTPPKTTLETTQKTTPQATQKTAPEATQKTTPQSKPAKKRKRAPSPDVIPNPPGCSYGLDLDYFYFSESDEEEVEETSQTEEVRGTSQNEESLSKNDSAMPKSALRSTTPAAKKVRFDASPQDSPSKTRHLPRATDPYTGSHFLAPGEKPHTSPTPRTDQMPTAAVSYHAGASSFATAPGSISGPREYRVGTAASPMTAQSTQPSAPAAAPTARAATGPASDHPAPRSPRPAPRHAPHPRPQPPKTPTKEDDELLAKARSQAEKFKPKTPSGLRTASRYSSPLTRLSDIFLNQQPRPDFGDDEFGRDAQWLYEQCPKGNLDKLAWPNKKNIVVAAEVEPVPRQLLTRTWNNLEADDNKTALSQLMDADADDNDLVE